MEDEQQRQQRLLAGGTSSSRKADWTPPTPGQLNGVLPNLQIIELIGQGGMGAVYKARQTHLDRVVAVKLLAPHLTVQADFTQRFQREAIVLARLSHPHIVAVYDVGEAGPWRYLVLEFVDGATLREVLSTGPFTAAAALTLAPQLCEALAYAHGQGIIHRDLKPENILIDAAGRGHIADFGLATLRGSALAMAITKTGDVLGTAAYMAPEQLAGARGVDHRADLYALGVIIYEMLTGHLPLGRFEAPSYQGRLDIRIDSVVLQALERTPELRWQSADAMGRAVDAIKPGPPTATRSGISWPMVAALCAAMIVGGILIGWLISDRDTRNPGERPIAIVPVPPPAPTTQAVPATPSLPSIPPSPFPALDGAVRSASIVNSSGPANPASSALAPPAIASATTAVAAIPPGPVLPPPAVIPSAPERPQPVLPPPVPAAVLPPVVIAPDATAANPAIPAPPALAATPATAPAGSPAPPIFPAPSPAPEDPIAAFAAANTGHLVVTGPGDMTIDADAQLTDTTTLHPDPDAGLGFSSTRGDHGGLTMTLSQDHMHLRFPARLLQSLRYEGSGRLILRGFTGKNLRIDHAGPGKFAVEQLDITDLAVTHASDYLTVLTGTAETCVVRMHPVPSLLPPAEGNDAKDADLIDARQLTTKHLDITIDGGGRLLLQGHADTLLAVLSDGGIDANTLSVGKADISVTGSGNILLGDLGAVDASCTGTGTVHWTGNPVLGRLIFNK